MKKILNVPFRKQLLAYDCFAAAVRMVLRYYGDDIDERKLYSQTIFKETKGAQDVKMAPVLIRKGYDVTTFWNGPIEQWGWGNHLKFIDEYKKEYRKAMHLGLKHKRNATVSLIRRFIDRGVPVLAEVNGDKFYGRRVGYSHVVVVSGYDRGSLYVNDPHQEFGGKTKRIPLARFRRAWERMSPMFKWDIGPLAGRSIFVMEPKIGLRQ